MASPSTVVRMVTPPDVVRHLDRLAARNGLSRSSQARMLLLDALRKNERDVREGYGDVLSEVPTDA